MNANRLKQARAASGLSLRDLAAKMGGRVTAQAISKYELGEMVPASDALILLCRALDVTAEYLLSTDNIEILSANFRKKASASKKDQATLEAQVIGGVERYLAIEEALGMNSGLWQKPADAPYQVRCMEDADTAANQLRQAWGMGTGPVPNLVELLEEKGVKIITVELPETVSGVLCWVKRNGGLDVPVILLNRTETGERLRFSLAHELAHLILEILEGDEEKTCNRFAAALLVEAGVLQREVGKQRHAVSPGELVRLKSTFNVSAQLIAYRCKDLGIISDAAMRSLYIQFSKLGWRSPPYAEPQPVQREVPQRFTRLCLRAYSERTISDARAAELLGIGIREMEKFLDPLVN